jgi:hypothetical protein
MYYGSISDPDDDVYQLREIYGNMGIKSGDDRVCDTIVYMLITTIKEFFNVCS